MTQESKLIFRAKRVSFFGLTCVNTDAIQKNIMFLPVDWEIVVHLDPKEEGITKTNVCARKGVNVSLPPCLHNPPTIKDRQLCRAYLAQDDRAGAECLSFVLVGFGNAQSVAQLDTDVPLESLPAD